LLSVLSVEEHNSVAPSKPSVKQLPGDFVVGIAGDDGAGVDEGAYARAVGLGDPVKNQLDSPAVLEY
jgi:hypothetical protein